VFACIFLSLPLACNMSYYVYKYIKLYLQWDPYPFLFGSPARYDTSIYAYLLIDLLQIPCQTCSFPPSDSPACSCPYRGDCKGNPRLPDPNPSKPLARLDQTYPLVSPAACSAHACSAQARSAHAITIPPPPASLYIPPHRRTHRPTR